MTAFDGARDHDIAAARSPTLAATGAAFALLLWGMM